MENNIKTRLIGPFKQILTMDNLPSKGPIEDHQLEIIVDGGILVRNGTIKKVGNFAELHKYSLENKHVVEFVEEDLVLFPGLIDPHTHICYGGSRAKDYAMRLEGKTYLEIAAEGGGIWDTVLKTRNASFDELYEVTVQRAKVLLQSGVTTAEVKSGYGLNFEAEIKMLETIKKVNETLAIDLIPTFLGAHIPDKDFKGNSSGYLKFLSDEILPEIKAKKLANRVDIFIEENAFSTQDASLYLEKAKMLDFDLTVHADQFSTGGSLVAIELGALSADHLEASGELEIKNLGKSEVVAVALPGASIGLGYKFTPARRLLDAGASLAIGSDWNPGSAPMGDLLMQAAVLGVYEKLSMAETWAAITTRAASALKIGNAGRLEKNTKADFIGFPCNDFREILYQQGKLKPKYVWKNGVIC